MQTIHTPITNILKRVNFQAISDREDAYLYLESIEGSSAYMDIKMIHSTGDILFKTKALYGNLDYCIYGNLMCSDFPFKVRLVSEMTELKIPEGMISLTKNSKIHIKGTQIIMNLKTKNIYLFYNQDKV